MEVMGSQGFEQQYEAGKFTFRGTFSLSNNNYSFTGTVNGLETNAKAKYYIPKHDLPSWVQADTEYTFMASMVDNASTQRFKLYDLELIEV